MGRYVVLCALAICCACSRHPVEVRHLPEPGYPSEALVENLQGTVSVTACFGADGKVVSVAGTGANPVLVKAAEDNARQWVFAPLPTAGEFPMCQAVEYSYKLEGKPMAVVAPVIVRTDLPYRLEIIGRPFKQDDRPANLAPRSNK